MAEKMINTRKYLTIGEILASVIVFSWAAERLLSDLVEWPRAGSKFNTGIALALYLPLILVSFGFLIFFVVKLVKQFRKFSTGSNNK